MRHGDFLWSEKYRPQTLDECLLPTDLKAQFQSYVDKKQIPNLLLSGPPGRGKTTAACCMLEQLDCPYIMLNGSLSTNKDTLRTDVTDWAMSMADNRKYVIIDEADGLTGLVQEALKAFMEEYAEHCGFIFTVNNPGKLIPAIHSRFVEHKFFIPGDEVKSLMTALYKRYCQILDAEGVQYDPKAIAAFAKSSFKDWRRGIKELQAQALKGPITSGILAKAKSSLDDVLPLVKNREYIEIANWVHLTEPNDIDLMQALLDNWTKYVEPASFPELFRLSNDMQDKATRVADRSVNLIDYLMQMASDVKFK